MIVEHHRRDPRILQDGFRIGQVHGIVGFEDFAHDLRPSRSSPRRGISPNLATAAWTGKTLIVAEARKTIDAVTPVERLIHQRMSSAVRLIPELAQHLIDSGGKRLRPLLTLAGARMADYGGDG